MLGGIVRLLRGQELPAMAQFEARTSAEGDRVVVALSGECDLAVEAEMTKTLLDAIELARPVVVDLGGLAFMDSSGIHGLVTAHRAAQERGGHVYVVNATGVVKNVLDVTGVADLLRPPATGDHDHV